MKFDLKVKNLKNFTDGLDNYYRDLMVKVDQFVKELSIKGVEIARLKITFKNAIYTGELIRSIDYKKGDVFKTEVTWYVYTGCPWAKFVEFGTGIVGARDQHYDATLYGWRYDVNAHGEKGWYYLLDDKWHWTKGMPSRPFMYETGMELSNIVVETAVEVFGNE